MGITVPMTSVAVEVEGPEAKGDEEEDGDEGHDPRLLGEEVKGGDRVRHFQRARLALAS